MAKRVVRRKTQPSQSKSKATADPCESHLPTMDDESESIHSVLSIDLDEPRVNDMGHRLYLAAIEQAREERRQARVRQQRKGRQTLATKKKPLTIENIDRLFEEKRQREPTIRADLMDLYQKSSSRIRSMLDIHQIDQFIQSTERRRAMSEEKKI
jgi:hypothetical protein